MQQGTADTQSQQDPISTVWAVQTSTMFTAAATETVMLPPPAATYPQGYGIQYRPYTQQAAAPAEYDTQYPAYSQQAPGPAEYNT